MYHVHCKQITEKGFDREFLSDEFVKSARIDKYYFYEDRFFQFFTITHWSAYRNFKNSGGFTRYKFSFDKGKVRVLRIWRGQLANHTYCLDNWVDSLPEGISEYVYEKISGFLAYHKIATISEQHQIIDTVLKLEKGTAASPALNNQGVRLYGYWGKLFRCLNHPAYREILEHGHEIEGVMLDGMNIAGASNYYHFLELHYGNFGGQLLKLLKSNSKALCKTAAVIRPFRYFLSVDQINEFISIHLNRDTLASIQPLRFNFPRSRMREFFKYCKLDKNKIAFEALFDCRKFEDLCEYHHKLMIRGSNPWFKMPNNITNIDGLMDYFDEELDKVMDNDYKLTTFKSIPSKIETENFVISQPKTKYEFVRHGEALQIKIDSEPDLIDANQKYLLVCDRKNNHPKYIICVCNDKWVREFHAHNRKHLRYEDEREISNKLEEEKVIAHWFRPEAKDESKTGFNTPVMNIVDSAMLMQGIHEASPF